jgi:hypothetical protein
MEKLITVAGTSIHNLHIKFIMLGPLQHWVNIFLHRTVLDKLNVFLMSCIFIWHWKNQGIAIIKTYYNLFKCFVFPGIAYIIILKILTLM